MRLEIPSTRALESQCGQYPAPVGTRIDTDPVSALFNLGADRVPMHNDAAMVGIVEKERLSDPAQVLLELVLDCNPGTDSSVNEEIVPEAARIDE